MDEVEEAAAAVSLDGLAATIVVDGVETEVTTTVVACAGLPPSAADWVTTDVTSCVVGAAEEASTMEVTTFVVGAATVVVPAALTLVEDTEETIEVTRVLVETKWEVCAMEEEEAAAAAEVEGTPADVDVAAAAELVRDVAMIESQECGVVWKLTGRIRHP